jgi:hypothetical protein
MRWEYFVMALSDTSWQGGMMDAADASAKLNALGNEGWELVSAMDTNWGHGASRQYVFVLKREKGRTIAPEPGA